MNIHQNHEGLLVISAQDIWAGWKKLVLPNSQEYLGLPNSQEYLGLRIEDHSENPRRQGGVSSCLCPLRGWFGWDKGYVHHIYKVSILLPPRSSL